MKILVKVEVTEDGLKGVAEAYRVSSTGHTEKELETHMIQALTFYFKGMPEEGEKIELELMRR